MNTQFALFPRVEQALVAQRTLLDGYDPQRRIGLILDEWGVWDRIPASDEKKYGKLWMQSTMRSAVAAGLGLNIFNRQADKLFMCNIAQLINVLQAVLMTDGPEGKNCVRTTSYYAFMLFKTHRGKTALKVEYDGMHTGMDQDPAPQLSISASKQGSQTVVTLVDCPSHFVTDWRGLRRVSSVRRNSGIAPLSCHSLESLPEFSLPVGQRKARLHG